MNTPSSGYDDKLIFISHSSVNVDQAMALVKVLEANKIPCWIAPRDLIGGQSYPAEIVRGIDLVRGMVLVLTKESNSSDMVLKEVERAVSKKKTIFPMRFDDIALNQSLEFLISTPHWIDANKNSFATASHQLIDAISKTFDGVPRPAPLPQKKAAPKAAFGIGAGVLAIALAGAAWKFSVDKPTVSQSPVAIAPIESPSPAAQPAKVVPIPVPAASTALASPSVAAPIAATESKGSMSSISSVLATLGNSGFAERVQLLDKEFPKIAGNVSTTDAESLLGGLSGADRLSALKIVAPRLTENTNAKQVRELLARLAFQDRVRAIEYLLPKIAAPISADDAQMLLSDTNNFRLSGITVISSVLQKELSGKQASELLGQLAFDERLKALDKVLPSLKKAQTSDDLLALLTNTNNFRAQGIKLLRDYIPTNLSSKAATEILENVAFDERTKSLDVMINALAKPIDAPAAVSLLKGTQNFRLDGLKILSPHLAVSITTNEVVEVLDSMSHDNRVAGIKQIAAKIKRPLSSDDLATIVKGSANFSAEAIKALK
jgi:TIR domain